MIFKPDKVLFKIKNRVFYKKHRMIGLFILIMVISLSLSIKFDEREGSSTKKLLSILIFSAEANPAKKEKDKFLKKNSDFVSEIINSYKEPSPNQDLELEPNNVPKAVFGLKKTKPIVVHPDFKNTWRKNAVQLTEMPPGPKIAIVIDDAGVDRNRTAEAIRLPAPLTISFLTYSKGLSEQSSIAKKAGHEIMVHMAMEPINKSVDPGPNVLLTKSPSEKILEQLRWGLRQFGGYVGINNHMGSHFTSDPVGMEIVMLELKRRGLLFLDSRTSEKTVAEAIALAHNVPFTQRNIFLDNEATISAINEQLRKMELFAKRNGYAVAIAHPREPSLKALSQWLPVMAERGFVQVPISAIVALQQGLSPIKLGELTH